MTSRLSFFVSTESQPRVRRAADAVTSFGGVLLVVWGVLGVDRQTPWERALTDLITSLPTWATSILDLGYALGLLYGLGIVAAMIVGGRKRRGALRDVVIALGGSTALAALLTLWVTGEWPYVLPELGLDDPDPRFPVMRVVVVTAILVAASPHLSRPMRRYGWFTITVTAIAAVGLGYGEPSDGVGGLGLGLLSAGVVLLIFGSPRGYPDPASVADALRRLGLPVEDVQIDHEQSWGVRRLAATTGDGTVISVKAYGRDASDSQLLAKAWRTLWYREDGRTLAYSRLQAVEHEALVTMLAGRAGVPVPEVLAAGQASSEIAMLAVSGGGQPLHDLDPADITDELITRVWGDVARLHASSISHGSLTTHAVHVIGGGHIIRDFSLGSLVASDSDRSHDVVEFLFSVSLLIGVERAVLTARAGLGREALAATLPYLQLPAVSSGTKKRAEKPKSVIEELQVAVVEATGQQLPEPVKLRRVSGRNLLMSGLLLLAAWALIPMLAGIDYAAVWEVLQDAAWGLIFIALVVGQTMFIPEAAGMMFAVPLPLPFWPLVTLQVAAKFIGLAVPSVAGRVAMNAAFLHKFGVSLTISVAQGAIDGFSGFLVQAVILVLAFFSGEVDLGLTNGDVDVEWKTVLIVVLLVVAATVVAVTRIRRLKDRLLPVVREGWGALVVVLRQPSRALGLLGSNLVTNLVMGATLWLVLMALDAPLGFGSALVAVVATFLLQGLVPIPGGIGVAEAVMTSFLVAMGVEESVAFAATIVYRVITFYLPALEGFPAMRWLERNEYL